jgi:hypothetical protein
MFIGFVLHHTGTVEHPPVWGEEVQARIFCKELNKLGIETEIINKCSEFRRIPDVSFHFASDIPIKNGKIKVVWLQNDWDFRNLEKDINQFDNKYDIILHASEELQKKHSRGYFFRMSADPEMYFPTSPTGAFSNVDIVYVSNNIKPYYNDGWVKPIANYFGKDRFRIYGSVWGGSGLEEYCAGAPPGLVVPDIFASAKIILSIHLEDHRKYNVTTCRIPEALLACKPVISDVVGKEIFNDYIWYGNCGMELVEKAEEILNDYEKAKEKALKGMNFVLENHTFKHRVKELIQYIKEKENP